MITSPTLHDQRLPGAKGSSYNPPGVSCVGMCSRTENVSPAQAAAPGASAPTFKNQPTESVVARNKSGKRPAEPLFNLFTGPFYRFLFFRERLSKDPQRIAAHDGSDLRFSETFLQQRVG